MTSGSLAGDAAALAIHALTVTLDNGRRLLADAGLTVANGEFVLLVGPSGSGKTTLLRLIAGLNDPDESGLQVGGHISVLGREHRTRSVPSNQTGLVFQNHALFDELSAIGNVQFAIDHRSTMGKPGTGEAVDLLRRLRVPTDGKLANLSGGERQRVAVARTLAMEPPILLFDEPTTGLDPARAKEVAELVVEAHERFHKTVITVTHDYRPFLPHKPRFVLLDPATASLRDVDESHLDRYFLERGEADIAAGDHQVPERPAGALRRRRTPVAKHKPPGRSRWLMAMATTGVVVWTLLVAPLAAVCAWGRPRWKLRYLWHYLRMVAIGTTAIYVAIAGAMLGFVFTLFSFSQIPHTQVMVPLLGDEFLAATGYSTYRVIIPILVGVLMAGKCGAAVAADVGARRLTHQYDALRSFGVDPQHYLYGNVVIALVIAGPLLMFVAYATNCYAALIAFLMSSDTATVAVFQRNFFATVWPITRVLPVGTGWFVIKGATGGLLIAAIAYAIGSRRKWSAVDVSRDVGLTIFWASIAVLLLHSAYAFVEF